MTMFSAAANTSFCGGGGGGVMSELEGYANSSSTTSTTGEASWVDHQESNNLINKNNIGGCSLMGDDEIIRKEEEGGEEESSSKDIGRDDDEEEWLQLSIGGGGRRHGNQVILNRDLERNNTGSNSNLVELELMPSSVISTNIEAQLTTTTITTSPFMLQQHHNIINPAPAGSSINYFAPRHHHHHQQEFINWAVIRPIPITTTISASSSASASYFQGVDPRPVLDFRIIQPPRRPHSGIWFMLQASRNQEKEPFLPQISKSYLRIKDGKMTVRLVIKYLANKLRLENESEIEIRCKGEKLLPYLTLEHVRDSIWSNPRDFITLLPNSSTLTHIMVLHYSRTPSFL